MKLEEINIEGKKIGTHEVSDKVFSFKPRKDLIQLVINWQLNNQRKKKGHTKSRGEVKGSRRKIVQQKGSGGARHGNITAPIFVGGGIAHGPRHRGQTRLTKLNKKIRNLGLISALSSKVLTNQINVFEEPKMDTFKTKSFDNFLSKLETRSALIIHHDGASEKFLKSIKNIPNAKRLKVIGTNVYDLIKFQKVLFTKEALKTLQDRLTKWETKISHTILF